MKAAPAELVAPDRPEVPAIAAALGPELSVRAGEPVTFDRVYLDTFDGLLYAARLALRWERGRYELLRGAEDLPRLTAAGPEPVEPVPGSALPVGELHDAVRAETELRALLPRARLRMTVQSVALLDDLDKTVARMEVVLPELVGGAGGGGGSGRVKPLRTRVRLLPVRGYERELERARERVERELFLIDAGGTLFEEAMAAAGERPEGVSAKIEVPLSFDERADAAAVAVLSRLLEIMDANLPGTLADTDPEFLHDYRVSVRRTRSVQKELKRVFPPDELARLRVEFKWLQQVTGEPRDLDVYVLGFESMRALVPERSAADLDPLLSLLRSRRLAARRAMRRELRSERAQALHRDWDALLRSLVTRDEEDRLDAARPIGEVAAQRIRKVYRRMLKMGGAITADSAPEEYHELRKQGKELRYLLELFGQPLHDADVVKPMIKSLKGLQDVLGHHQDREVQMATLAGMRDDVAALPGGPAALMAMGVLVERLEEDARAARVEFADAFATFSSKQQRRLVDSTFKT